MHNYTEKWWKGVFMLLLPWNDYKLIMTTTVFKTVSAISATVKIQKNDDDDDEGIMKVADVF